MLENMWFIDVLMHPCLTTYIVVGSWCCIPTIFLRKAVWWAPFSVRSVYRPSGWCVWKTWRTRLTSWPLKQTLDHTVYCSMQLWRLCGLKQDSRMKFRWRHFGWPFQSSLTGINIHLFSLADEQTYGDIVRFCRKRLDWKDSGGKSCANRSSSPSVTELCTSQGS